MLASAIAGAVSAGGGAANLVTGLSVFSATIPELQTVFKAGDLAEAFNDGASLVEKSIGRYRLANARSADAGQPSDMAFTEHGAKLASEVGAALSLVAKALTAKIPTREEVERAAGVFAEFTSFDASANKLEIVKGESQQIAFLQGGPARIAVAEKPSIAEVSLPTKAQDNSAVAKGDIAVVTGKAVGETRVIFVNRTKARAVVTIVVVEAGAGTSASGKQDEAKKVTTPPVDGPADLKTVQQQLNFLQSKTKLKLDGLPGKETKTALKKFQKAAGREQSGTLDAITAKALAAAVSDQVDSLKKAAVKTLSAGGEVNSAVLGALPAKSAAEAKTKVESLSTRPELSTLATSIVAASKPPTSGVAIVHALFGGDELAKSLADEGLLAFTRTVFETQCLDEMPAEDHVKVLVRAKRTGLQFERTNRQSKNPKVQLAELRNHIRVRIVSFAQFGRVNDAFGGVRCKLADGSVKRPGELLAGDGNTIGAWAAK